MLSYTERWPVSKKQLRTLPEHRAPKFTKTAKAAITASQHTLEAEYGDVSILQLCVWNRTERLFTIYIANDGVWCGKDITYVHADKRWSQADLDYNMGRVAKLWRYRNEGVTHIPKESGRQIAEYFDDSTTAPLLLIEREMRRHRTARYNHNTEYRRNRAARIAAQRKPLPYDFERWTNNHLFINERYIIYHREKKTILGRCSCCQSAVSIPAKKGMKHGTVVKCPACGKKAKLYAEGRSSRGVIAAGDYAIVANRIDEGLLLRCIYVSREIDITTAQRRDRYHPEMALYVVGIREDISIEKYTNWQTKEEYWDKAKEASMCHTPYFRAGKLYTANLHYELRGTPWKYSALEEMPNAVERLSGADISSYLDMSTSEPMVERLMRVGLYRLVLNGNEFYYPATAISTLHHYIQTGEKKLHRALGVRRADIPILRRLNITREELEVYRHLHSKDPEKLIRYMREKKVGARTTKALLESISTAQLERLLYVYAPEQQAKFPQQNASIAHIVQDYLDYLHQCAELRRDMTDTSNLWPVDLNKRHAELSAQIKRNKSVIEDKAVRHRWKTEHRSYEYKSDGFAVVMPRNASEIITEGKLMCHCVATYAARVARGETTILFVRSLDNLSKPLATAEVCDGRTRQIRARGNRTPPDEVMRFWQEYEERVLKPLNEAKNKIKVKAG